MRYPDEPRPSTQLTLFQFVQVAEDLQRTDDMHDFARFVCAGRWGNDDQEQRVFVNARQDARAPPTLEYELRRDFDSAIGITKDLPFHEAMAVFPMASFDDTLKRDNHIKGVIPGVMGAPDVKVPLHQIPNMGLGKVKRRHITRIFFPMLWRQGQSPSISQDIFAFVYDQCLRPTVRQVLAVDQTHWPVSYAAAMIQNRGPHGRLHFPSVDVAASSLGDFATELLVRLERHSDLRNAFFVHELRGTKGSSLHNPAHEWERDAALDDQMEFLDVRRLDPNQWTIDVGMEIRHGGHVVQWLTSAHRRLLEFALPSSTDQQITSIMESQKQYKLDLSAQFSDLGGCRVTPGSRGRYDQVIYINIYTTDKSSTYQLHDGVFRRHTASDLLPSSIENLIKGIEGMAAIFNRCAGIEWNDGLEGCARFELRVPLLQANEVLTDFPDNIVQETVVSYPRDCWWLAKYYRLCGFHWIVKCLQNSPPAGRILRASLALGAITIYQLNALIYRPGEGKAEKELLDAACQHILRTNDSDSEEDDDNSEPIMYRRGLYFLSDIVSDKYCYRLPACRPLGGETLARLYRRPNIGAVEQEFNIVRLKGSTAKAHPSRIHNRRTRTLDIRYVRREEEEGGSSGPSLGLAERGVVLRPRIQMTGPDAHMELGSDESDRDGDVDAQVTRIFRQFPYDVFQVAPNHKKHSSGSWTLLTTDARNKLKIDIFKSLDLREVFYQVQYRVLNEDLWRNVMFPRYFPAKGQAIPPKMQNFPSTQYFQQWVELMNRLSHADAKIVRRAVFKKFDELHWLPHGGSDRMWATAKMTTAGWTMVPAGQPQACPQLAVNQKWFCHQVVIVGQPRPELEEEEVSAPDEG